MIEVYERDGALLFKVRVVPRASRSEIAGEHDGTLRVRVAAPPVDGSANEELVRTLAKAFNVPQRNLLITSGQASKLKQDQVKGITLEQLQSILKSL